jgi:hypothetical protein
MNNLSFQKILINPLQTPSQYSPPDSYRDKQGLGGRGLIFYLPDWLM